MQALTPKQKQTMKLGTQQPKREAPNAPGSVPKSSGLAEAVDVMSMTDTEYAAWRASKRKRR
jgi:hypothetical protein